MKQRSPAMVILLSIITFHICVLVWEVMTKEELNSKGASIPTAWLIIIPFIGPLLFAWFYGQGAEKVTKESGPVVFLIIGFLGIFGIGPAIMQSKYNKLA